MSSGPITETVTLSQARELIRCLSHEQSVLVLSPPGVGKSDVVRQAAADAGLECKSLLGTQIAPEDVSGVPRIIGERSVFCRATGSAVPGTQAAMSPLKVPSERSARSQFQRRQTCCLRLPTMLPQLPAGSPPSPLVLPSPVVPPSPGSPT